MTVKGKSRLRTRKSTKGRKKSSFRYKTRHSKTHSRRRLSIRGGNYKSDITTRTTEGQPTKDLHKFVVTGPGIGVLSGAAYIKLMANRDRNGNDNYD